MSTESWLESRLSKLLGFSGTKEIAGYVLSIDDRDEQASYLEEVLDPDDAQHQDFLREFRNNRPERNPAESGASETVREPAAAGEKPAAKAGKTKYRSLYSKDKVVMLKGRNPCDCVATKHDLVNNCLRCGKVVCRQEGSGPCLFCGALVCTKEEQQVLERGSRKSEQLRQKLMAEAEAQKDRLLEFDRTSEKRTKVIDDESDYFSVDAYKWMTEDQRRRLKEKEEEAKAKKESSRKDRRLIFDFAGRRVVEEGDAEAGGIVDEEALAEILQNTSLAEPISNPNFDFPRPKIFKAEEKRWLETLNLAEGDGSSVPKGRLQDRELQEMSDRGMCLSLHQPYASFLVQGIMVHEGRTWYSPHRGRLWIHAASRQPSDQEVEDLQNFYRARWNRDIQFPSQLPVSCLLGSVDVLDVLPQEEYEERFPDGGSGSPYVFVCANPQEMAIKLPMGGQHKIYKLDPKLHNAAVKSPKKPPVIF